MCNFCQNYDISNEGAGSEVDDQQLAEMMLDLQRRGCHNINLVTPTHVDLWLDHSLADLRIRRSGLDIDRNGMFQALRHKGIGVNVHYIPVHLHPFYRKQFGTLPGLCPAAEAAYEQILSIPMFAAMTEGQTREVIDRLNATVAEHRR